MDRLFRAFIQRHTSNVEIMFASISSGNDDDEENDDGFVMNPFESGGRITFTSDSKKKIN